MGAMPFAQHPAQKHREPACFCNATFRAKASRAWPLVSAITPRVVAESDVRQADRPLCSSTCRSQGRRTSTSIHSPNS